MAYGLTQSLDLERSSSQYAAIADASQTGLDLSTSFTIEAWIKLESLPSTAGDIFSIAQKYDYAAGQRQYGFYITTANKLHVVFFGNVSGTPNSQFSCDTVFDSGDLGVWQHVAVAVNISTPSATFYIDGVAQTDTASSTAATSIANGTAYFAIGAYDITSSAEGFFDGKISLVRVWSTERSSSDISDNICNVLGSTTNLKGEWTFDNVYTDNSGNGNTLTSSGSPVFSSDVPSTCGVVSVNSNFFAFI